MRFVHDHNQGVITIYSDVRPSSYDTMIGQIYVMSDGRANLSDWTTYLDFTGATFDSPEEAINFAKINMRVPGA